MYLLSNLSREAYPADGQSKHLLLGWWHYNRETLARVLI